MAGYRMRLCSTQEVDGRTMRARASAWFAYLLAILLCACLAPLWRASAQAIPYDIVEREERASLLGAAPVGTMPFVPDLDIHAMCTTGGGINHGYVDTSGDGLVDTFRHYGAAMMPPEEWRTAPRTLPRLRSAAVHRAHFALMRSIEAHLLVGMGIATTWDTGVAQLDLRPSIRAMIEATANPAGHQASGRWVTVLPGAPAPEAAAGLELALELVLDETEIASQQSLGPIASVADGDVLTPEMAAWAAEHLCMVVRVDAPMPSFWTAALQRREGLPGDDVPPSAKEGDF